MLYCLAVTFFLYILSVRVSEHEHTFTLILFSGCFFFPFIYTFHSLNPSIYFLLLIITFHSSLYYSITLIAYITIILFPPFFFSHMT